MQINRKRKWASNAVVILMIGLLPGSCVKKDHGEPPLLGNPDIVANISIKGSESKI